MPFNQIEFRRAPSAQTDRQHSHTIWQDCPWEEIQNGSKDGVAYFDDFNDLPLFPTLTTQIAYGKYKAFAANSNTIGYPPNGQINSLPAPGGILQLTGAGGTVSDCFSISQANPAYLLSGVTSNSNKLWFECRIAVQNITANHSCFFIGLGETNLITLTAISPFATGGTGLAIVTTGSLLGWKSQMAQTVAGQLNAVYSDRAATFTFAGLSTASDGPGISAAFTFTKLGFIYDPADKDGYAVRFYQDGVYTGTKITNAALVALTNLPVNPLGLIFSQVEGSGAAAADATYLDWWRCAQLYTLGGPA